MVEINPRTFPIALALGGVIIISIAVYAYSFGQRADFSFTVILMLIDLCAILLAVPVYVWERNKYYQDRKEIHL